MNEWQIKSLPFFIGSIFNIIFFIYITLRQVIRNNVGKLMDNDQDVYVDPDRTKDASVETLLRKAVQYKIGSGEMTAEQADEILKPFGGLKKESE